MLKLVVFRGGSVVWVWAVLLTMFGRLCCLGLGGSVVWVWAVLLTMFGRFVCAGSGMGKANAPPHPPTPQQRQPCGTDRSHLALLCQLLQLVGVVLHLDESLLHIVQRLQVRGGGQRACRDQTLPPFLTITKSVF